MRVLVSYNDSSKLKAINCGTELPDFVETTYNLQPKSYILQIFNKEFEAFIDLEDFGDVVDMSKNKVVLVREPSFAGSSVQDVTCSLTFNEPMCPLEGTSDLQPVVPLVQES